MHTQKPARRLGIACPAVQCLMHSQTAASSPLPIARCCLALDCSAVCRVLPSSVPQQPVIAQATRLYAPQRAPVPAPQGLAWGQPAGTVLPHRRCKYGCRRNSTPRCLPTYDEGGPAADAQAAVKLGEELAGAKHSDSRASQGAKAPLEARRRRVPHARGLLIDCEAGGRQQGRVEAARHLWAALRARSQPGECLTSPSNQPAGFIKSRLRTVLRVAVAAEVAVLQLLKLVHPGPPIQGSCRAARPVGGSTSGQQRAGGRASGGRRRWVVSRFGPPGSLRSDLSAHRDLPGTALTGFTQPGAIPTNLKHSPLPLPWTPAPAATQLPLRRANALLTVPRGGGCVLLWG